MVIGQIGVAGINAVLTVAEDHNAALVHAQIHRQVDSDYHVAVKNQDQI